MSDLADLVKTARAAVDDLYQTALDLPCDRDVLYVCVAIQRARDAIDNVAAVVDRRQL